MSVQRIYEYALQREREGMDFFQRNAERMSHAAAVEIFRKLAAEEQKHIEFIQGLLEALESGQPALETGPELEQEDLFAQRAELERLDQTTLESMVPDLTVLRMAYLIERDFAEFYETAAQKVEESDASEALTMLAHWERGHEQLFKDIHDKLLEEYMNMPWGG
jgi:rubrerythrin